MTQDIQCMQANGMALKEAVVHFAGKPGKQPFELMIRKCYTWTWHNMDTVPRI